MQRNVSALHQVNDLVFIWNNYTFGQGRVGSVGRRVERCLTLEVLRQTPNLPIKGHFNQFRLENLSGQHSRLYRWLDVLQAEKAVGLAQLAFAV